MGHLGEYIESLLDTSQDFLAPAEAPDIELWLESPAPGGRSFRCLTHGLPSAEFARLVALSRGPGHYYVCNQFGNVDEFAVS